jgi:hypothetical protein
MELLPGQETLCTPAKKRGYKNYKYTLSVYNFTSFYSCSFDPALEFVYKVRSSAMQRSVFWCILEFLTIEAADCLETSVHVYPTSRCHIQEILTFVFTAVKISNFIQNSNIHKLC